MTPAELSAIRARLAAATPGTQGAWTVRQKEGDYACEVLDANQSVVALCETNYDEQDLLDAEFIAHAPADIAALLQEVERLQTMYSEHDNGQHWPHCIANYNAKKDECDAIKRERFDLRAENARLHDKIAELKHKDSVLIKMYDAVEKDARNLTAENARLRDEVSATATGALEAMNERDDTRDQLARAVELLKTQRIFIMASDCTARNLDEDVLAFIRTTEGGE